MTDQVSANGMTLAPGVVDTIISIAVTEVDGVASIGAHSAGGIRQMISSKPNGAGIETKTDEDGKLEITLHIEVSYGYVLPDLAAQIRSSVSDALRVQAGIEVASVDIYVDGIQFDRR